MKIDTRVKLLITKLEWDVLAAERKNFDHIEYDESRARSLAFLLRKYADAIEGGDSHGQYIATEAYRKASIKTEFMAINAAVDARVEEMTRGHE